MRRFARASPTFSRPGTSRSIELVEADTFGATVTLAWRLRSRRAVVRAVCPLSESAYRDIVSRALAEDIGRGDVTTNATVPAGARGHGVLLAKSPLVVAGMAVAAAAFELVDPAAVLTPRADEGAACEPGAIIGEVRGPARALLTAERVALNFLQRLSGVATITRRFVEASGGRITILDTRKTTPTLRALEKYAVRMGGGTNHRFGLYDAFLIKDNHIRLAGGIASAVRAARQLRAGSRGRGGGPEPRAGG